MALEEVFTPPRKAGSTIDPKSVSQKDVRDANYWEQKAREAKAEKEAKLELKEIERIEKGDRDKPPESPFKVTGAVNLGNFDLQEQSRAMETKMKEIEEKYENQIGAISEKSDHYRDELHKAQIQMLSDQFQLQLGFLTKQIAAGQSRQPSFEEQMEKVKNLATQLGFQPMSTVGKGNPELEIRMLELQHAEAARQRDFEWKLKQYDLEREQRLEEAKIKREVEMERIKAERERNNMLATLPDTIGGALARGLLDAGSNNNAISRRPQQPRQYRIEASLGQQGEVPCPNCQTPVAILPETEVAVCAGCGARMPITRTPQEIPKSTPPGQPFEQQLSPEEAERAG